MSEQKWAITTGKKDNVEQQAMAIGQAYRIPYVPRKGYSLEELVQMHQLEHLFVYTNEGLAAFTDGIKLFFHPGMAVMRYRSIKQEGKLPLWDILDLTPKSNILDCTVGMASDALSFALGLTEDGKIDALESSAVIYVIVHYGLAHYQSKYTAIQKAMEKITVHHADYKTYLPQCQTKYDCIYFDPMFDFGLKNSNGINPLRPVADYRPLEQADIEYALTLTERVVVKHRKGAKMNIAFREIIGGKYSPIAYGICY